MREIGVIREECEECVLNDDCIAARVDSDEPCPLNEIEADIYCEKLYECDSNECDGCCDSDQMYRHFSPVIEDDYNY